MKKMNTPVPPCILFWSFAVQDVTPDDVPFESHELSEFVSFRRCVAGAEGCPIQKLQHALFNAMQYICGQDLWPVTGFVFEKMEKLSCTC